MKKLIVALAIISSFYATAQLTDVVTSGLVAPFDVVIEGNDAFIVEFQGNTISRIDITDANPTLENVVTGIASPTTLLFDNDDVYIAQVNGLITRREASDLTSNQTTIASGLTTPVSLVRSGDFLYFSEFQGARIGRINLANNNTVETVIAGLNFPEQMALIDDQLYITISGSGSIGRININDANPQLEIITTGLNTPAGIVASGDTIFVTEFVTNGSIFNINTADANPVATELVNGLDNPFGIALGDDALFVVQNGSNRLSRYDGDLLNITDINQINDLSIYPNPSTGSFQISGLENITVASATIYDITGKKVQSITPQSILENNINVAGLTRGTYILTIVSFEQNILNHKIIIQ